MDKILQRFQDQKYEEIKAKGQKFTDDMFPPTYESINFKIEVPKQNIMSSQQTANKVSPKLKYKWYRITEIFNEIHLMSNENLIDDVVQGDLGDCYYLSALSALAEYNKRIENIFKTKAINELGCYVIYCYIHGKPVELVLDDYFPCVEFNNKPVLAFSNVETKDMNIWPLLLEKAWAKVNRNYDNITEGNAAQAFQFLTSSGIEIHFHAEDFFELYNYIQSADKRKFIICCDISDNPNAAPISLITSLGLITNHAYSIISVHQVISKTGEIEKLLRIRNPWGKLEWNGDWSDNSEKWTPELKKELNIQNDDDGTFFMSFKDFLHFYTCTYICKYYDNYIYESERFYYKPKKIFHLISVEFKEKTHGFFILNLKNCKIYSNLKQKKIFINYFVTFSVYRVDNNQYKLIDYRASRLDRQDIEADIEPGTYVICINFPKDFNKNVIYLEEYLREMESFNNKISFRIGFYSTLKNLVFKEIETTSSFYEVLHQFALDKSHNNKLKEIFYQEGEPDTWRCLDFTEKNPGIGYLTYFNNSDAVIREKLIISSCVNVRLIPLINQFNNHLNSDVNNDQVMEDEYEDTIIKLFRKYLDNSKSTFTHSIKNEKVLEITEENPLIVDMSIAPNSTAVILIEKFDEFATFNADSEINMNYPVDYIFMEKHFPTKKTRIKYKNDFLNIFENIIKYPTGVMFKYKNRTKEYKIEITITFSSLVNLQINRSYDNIIELIDQEFRKIDKRHDNEKTDKILKIIEDNKKVKLTLYPSQYNYKEFSYKSNIDYNITVSEFHLLKKNK